MPITPKPCPFCGSSRISVHFKRAARKSGYQVVCLQCRTGQTHTMHPDHDQAVAVWNERAPTAFEQEYASWMKYHDSGEGDFQGFIAQYHNLK
ncbi:Lar family restriction alleviation protein (plasmid) [Vogesella sp. XCS3]|nr:Lar family restriction alleviation protein [Vogesella sp. XCS3]UDM18895.1 Lar family restriction alleviation protein [Vogesella sp. XCS3]